MLYLLLSNGDHEEHANAFYGGIESEEFVIRDFVGEVIERMPRIAVTAYGTHVALRAASYPGEARQIEAITLDAPLSVSSNR